MSDTGEVNNVFSTVKQLGKTDDTLTKMMSEMTPPPHSDTIWVASDGTAKRWNGMDWVPYPGPAAPNQLAVVTDTLVDIAKKLETVIAFQKEQLTALHHIQVRLDISAKPPPLKPPNIPLF